MDEQLKALARDLDELVKRFGLTDLDVRYDPRYIDEAWEISLTFKNEPLTGEGRTAAEAVQRLAEQLEAVS